MAESLRKKPSIKSKLKAISRSAHRKSAHFEEENQTPRKIDFGQEDREDHDDDGTSFMMSETFNLGRSGSRNRAVNLTPTSVHTPTQVNVAREPFLETRGRSLMNNENTVVESDRPSEVQANQRTPQREATLSPTRVYTPVSSLPAPTASVTPSLFAPPISHIQPSEKGQILHPLTNNVPVIVSTPAPEAQDILEASEALSGSRLTTPRQSPFGSSVSGAGFLSSMLTAATQLGTTLALVTQPNHGNQKNDAALLLPHELEESHEEAVPEIVVKPIVHTIGEGELSLKDMGIETDTNLGQEGPKEVEQVTATVSETLSPDQTKGARPRRSTSVRTDHSRRRRSSLVSHFGQDAATPQKITGFAVASNKRNREFHATFRSVPEEDYLLDDYGCALQKEILVQGRIYISEGHLCFNSNIFGWVTNLVIAFNDIIAIDKKSTAGIFPNAIQITTLNAKNVFASFISRDTTYDLIVNIWRLTHPLTQSTAHGVSVADSNNAEDSYSDDHTDSDEDHLGFDSSEDEVSMSPAASAESQSVDPSSHANLRNGDTVHTKNTLESTATVEEGDFPGPATHAPTEAPSLKDGTSFSKDLSDEEFRAPLGEVFSLLFGEDSSFMQDFFVQNQGLLEVTIGKWGAHSGPEGKRKRHTRYVKLLSGPIGPKQTSCLIDEFIEIQDFEKCVQVLSHTTTPDVPNGDAFVIKTRISLMWAPNNYTRLVSNCTIEWSKSSWIKGAIEKGANNGQVEYMRALCEAARERLNSGGQKKKKKGRKVKSKEVEEEMPVAVVTAPPPKAVDNSILGQITGALEHVNINLLLVVVMFGMVLSMMRMQRSIREVSTAVNNRGSLGANPIILQNNRWQQEEADLWAWMEERSAGKLSAFSQTLNERQNIMKLDRKIRQNKGMTQRQIEEALAQADQRLQILKAAQKIHEQEITNHAN